MFSHYMLMITDINHPHLAIIKKMKEYRWANKSSGVVQIRNNAWSGDARFLEDYIYWNDNNSLAQYNRWEKGTLPLFQTGPNNSLIFKGLI